MQSSIENIELNNLWEKAISILKNKLDTPTFEGGLKHTKIESIDDNTVTIMAGNKISKEMLERKPNKNLIELAFHTVSGKKLDVKFLLSPSSLSQKGPQKITFEKNPPPVQSKKVLTYSYLNPKYTFSNFVIGNSNSLAHAASLAVAESPAKVYNPLFIYGGVGLGKTHLMNAIGHQALYLRPDLHVTYISTETFTNELIEAIKTRETTNFRNKYRTVDILLIDDIHFLISKEGTQEEFFHTFNHLHSVDKQIVITSDRPPKEIPTLQDRLRSRFEWGLIADIQPPDFETRQAILRKKAEMENIHIHNNVIQYIASIIPSNIRELEGALVRVMAYASLKKTKINISIAKEAIESLHTTKKQDSITIPDIMEKTAKYFAINMEELCTGGREQKLARARQIGMYLARELTKTSFPEIGKHFGGRDHTTVLHAYNKMKEETDPAIKAHINNIKNEFNAF